MCCVDHDFRISRDDLLRYGNHSLTYRIVDRIFSQAGRPFHRTTTNGGPPAPGAGAAPPGAANNNGGGSMRCAGQRRGRPSKPREALPACRRTRTAPTPYPHPASHCSL